MDETGQSYLYRTYIDPRTGECRRESYLTSGKSTSAVFGRAPLRSIMWLAISLAVIVIVMVITLLAGVRRLPGVTDEEMNRYSQIVVDRGFPDRTVFAEEYKGSLREGGIVR